MKTSVRDIIVNACDETGLRNRNQPVPANIFESAFILLQNRLRQYSNTNFLSFTRKELNFKPQKNIVTVGEYELNEDYEGLVTIYKQINDIPDASEFVEGQLIFVKENKTGYIFTGGVLQIDESAPSWFDSFPDFEAEKLQEVVRCFVQYNGTPSWDELNFVAYEDYYKFTPNSLVYSYKPINDTLIEVYLPTNYKDYNFKLIYNEYFEITKDTEFNIPNQFIALFTAGLVYDLATNYPRLSDGTVALLKTRLDELEENVRRSSSVNKFLGRPLTRSTFTYSDFVNGRFLGI